MKRLHIYGNFLQECDKGFWVGSYEDHHPSGGVIAHSETNTFDILFKKFSDENKGLQLECEIYFSIKFYDSKIHSFIQKNTIVVFSDLQNIRKFLFLGIGVNVT